MPAFGVRRAREARQQQREAQARAAAGRLVRPFILRGRALLCVDCDAIYETVGAHGCPRCGSHVAWPIGKGVPALEEGGAK